MSVVVEFHPDAADEAVETHQWYAERSEKAAERFLAELDRAIENIGDFPDRYPAIPSIPMARVSTCCDVFRIS